MLPSIALNEQLCLPRLARVEGLFSHLHFHSSQGEMALGGWLASGWSSYALYFLGGRYS